MADTTTRIVPGRSSRAVVLAAAWVTASTLLAASGGLARVPALVGVWVFGSVAGWVLAYGRSLEVKRILDGLDLRVVIAVHLVRIPIGALFLWEHAAGRLPATFAYRAGLGDIAVGVLAIGAIAAVSRSRLVLTWSIVGLVDIVLVVVTAQYLVLVASDPLMLAAFSRLPYPLLPTLVVPVVIATHILVIARCRAAPSAAGQSTNSG